jgi:hypothetical protein
MILTNWEFFIDSGNPVVGATVKVRDAVVSHPNTGTVLSSTSTDSNGMWTFTGLSATAKDVEVIWGAVRPVPQVVQGHDAARGRRDLLRHGGAVPASRAQPLAAPGVAGETVLWVDANGALKKRSGVAGATSTVADFDAAGSNNVLRSTGWGKVATADIVADAVTQRVGTFVNSPSLVNTTALTALGLSSGAITTTVGGNILLLATFMGVKTTVTGFVNIQLYIDGSPAPLHAYYQDQTANLNYDSSFSHMLAAGGTHTYAFYWACPTAASTISMVQGLLQAIELKK